MPSALGSSRKVIAIAVTEEGVTERRRICDGAGTLCWHWQERHLGGRGQARLFTFQVGKQPLFALRLCSSPLLRLYACCLDFICTRMNLLLDALMCHGYRSYTDESTARKTSMTESRRTGGCASSSTYAIHRLRCISLSLDASGQKHDRDPDLDQRPSDPTARSEGPGREGQTDRGPLAHLLREESDDDCGSTPVCLFVWGEDVCFSNMALSISGLRRPVCRLAHWRQDLGGLFR
ncbi:hypothetical protein J3F83DRAFT_726562 [Trichoderma novae-zelandiae]